jgi:hypothetical protein
VILAPAGLVVSGHANFRQQVAGNMACTINHDPKTYTICSHETISLASRPLDILCRDLISDATV